MKPLRKVLLTASCGIIALAASCGKSGTIKKAPVYCQSLTCQHSGTCQYDTCGCQEGYEGTYCERLSRENFIGVYAGYEITNSGGIADSIADTFTIAIIDTSDTYIRATSIHHYTGTVCKVQSSNSFRWYAGSSSYTGGFTDDADTVLLIRISTNFGRSSFYGKKF